MKKMNDYYAHQLNLDEQQINDILRLCHRSLEEHMQMEFTDEQFLQIFSIWRKYTPIHAYQFTPIANSTHYNKLFSQALCNHYRIKNVGQANQLAWKLKQWLEADFPTAQQYKHIVLHIPHAGTKIMPEAKNGLKRKEIEKDSQYQIDYYTDELFAGATLEDLKSKIIPVIFPYNRLLCDVERLPNDPLEKEHKGIVRGSYGHFCSPYHNLLDVSFLYSYYVDHHACLAKTIMDADGCLLLDCHSFSCVNNPLLPDAEKFKDIDICIGYNEDTTKPRQFVINTISHYFIEHGYRVQINSPFSNSKTVDLPTHFTYHSLMIEVNKSLYMDEETLEKKPEGFAKLQNDIQELYKLILR